MELEGAACHCYTNPRLIFSQLSVGAGRVAVRMPGSNANACGCKQRGDNEVPGELRAQKTT